MYDAFAVLDGGGDPENDDDRRVSREELAAGLGKILHYPFAAFEGLDADSADAVFDEADEDGRGFILLAEWCRFIERKEVAAATARGAILTIGDNDNEDE
eukprot:TRINITY_DN20633_c0_g1_i5.p3 TRINITY_DN20633_c0_g1~~TRINITY_DN20633_c0_g1_i5.p3  ORF type:complete len:100 (+),score=23.62 TRINITY_DN20633_c0_g1_i5:637-936(+)